MFFLQNIITKRVLILGFTICFASCAIHSSFPFICFERGCVAEAFGTRGLKKRIKGKIFAMHRKLNKRQVAKVSPKPAFTPSVDNDSSVVEKGNCVDYHKFTLLFRLKQQPDCYDSIIVEYTSQHQALTEYSQSHLYLMLDTIRDDDVLNVYIKNTLINEQHPENDLTWTRTRSICKVLRRSGIQRLKIKLLKANESPPEL